MLITSGVSLKAIQTTESKCLEVVLSHQTGIGLAGVPFLFSYVIDLIDAVRSASYGKYLAVFLDWHVGEESPSEVKFG